LKEKSEKYRQEKDMTPWRKYGVDVL